jgi:hypothetical protein
MSEKAKPVAAAPRVPPSHILLLDDWGRHRAGTVLIADTDLIGALDVEHVRFRAATPHERALAGLA